MSLSALIGPVGGFLSGSISIWLSFKVTPYWIKPPASSSLKGIVSQVWQLTDPGIQTDFLKSYLSILRGLAGQAIYRTVQAVVGIVPLFLLYLAAAFWLQESWGFLVGTTIGSLVSLTWFWMTAPSLKSSSPKSIDAD